MDAHALLSAQGWRGDGHSLHANDDSVGLSKPLLLNRKDNTHGLGNKKHFTSDQWWLDAFDEQVKGLDTSKEGTVVQTVTTGRLNTIGRGVGRYALYASFVQGGLLQGSIPKSESAESSPVGSPGESPGRVAVAEEREGIKQQPRETKEERRARREAKQQRKTERLARKISQIETPHTSVNATTSGSKKHKETTEERRARKEAKRKTREARKLQRGR